MSNLVKTTVIIFLKIFRVFAVVQKFLYAGYLFVLAALFIRSYFVCYACFDLRIG